MIKFMEYMNWPVSIPVSATHMWIFAVICLIAMVGGIWSIYDLKKDQEERNKVRVAKYTQYVVHSNGTIVYPQSN